MRWIWIGAGALAILVVVVLVVGWLMPVRHRASRQATFRAAPAAVWELITDVEAFPGWRGDVKAVERLPESDMPSSQIRTVGLIGGRLGSVDWTELSTLRFRTICSKLI